MSKIYLNICGDEPSKSPLNLFKIKLSEQFRFLLVGVIQIFVNNNNFEENILSTNLNFSIDLEDEKNIESKKCDPNFETCLDLSKDRNNEICPDVNNCVVTLVICD